MTRPLILAVDEDPAELERAESALQRYGRDYRIRGETSGDAARRCLELAQARRQPVALVLAAPELADVRGPDLLTQVHGMHPDAKRALLVPWGAWGDRQMAETMLATMARGQMDYYVLRPLPGEPDELFHRTIAEFLHEWSRATGRANGEVTLVLPKRESRGAEIRDMIIRNGVPHMEFDTDSPTGAACLAEHELAGTREPVVIVHGRATLRDPTRQEVARALGVETDLGDDREFDVLIVGAGPAGLATAVYASSEGLSALVVERDAIGGQAGTSSLIRNYLGFSRGISGAELAQRSYQQAWVFGTRFLHTREVLALHSNGTGQRAEISGVGEVRARATVLAGGVTYRKLAVPSLERLSGAGVFYGASVSEARGLVGARVFVVGGGNSAGQAALHLARYAEQVTLLVRGPDIATTMSQYLVEAIAAEPAIDILTRHEVAEARGEGCLEQLVLTDRDSGEQHEVRADALFVLIGARPHTDWLPAEVARDDGGYLLTGAAIAECDAHAPWPLERHPRAYETSMPGVFAVGDMRHGSVKRVASGVGEGSVVVQQLHEHLHEIRVGATSAPSP